MPYKIGDSVPSLVTLESLGIPDPVHEFKPYMSSKFLHSGGKRALGPPYTKWSWGYLENAAREALRTKMPNPSGEIYITTPTNESGDAFADFLATYHWPDDEPRPKAGSTKRDRPEIEFFFMEEQTP